MMSTGNIDIGLLRAFMEVEQTRHFGRASENLYLTQSAVSARIKQLESSVGVALFERYRNNIQLTHAGEMLLPYVEEMLKVWGLASEELANLQQFEHVSIAAPQSVWTSSIKDVPMQLSKLNEHLHIKVEAIDSSIIIRRLTERTLDIGLMFDPSKSDELACLKLMDLDLQLFTSKANASVADIQDNNYIFVDWGISFSSLHAKHFPQIKEPTFKVCSWQMAIDFLAQTEGFALLPVELGDEYADSLYKVTQAPMIIRSIYMAYNKNNPNKELIKQLVQTIKLDS